MSHEGLLNPVYTFTPIRTNWDTVTSLTIACTMYSIPFNTAIDSTDESNKVLLGSDSFTWSVPTAHQSTADPYKINWKYLADRTQERQMTLIKASADYKTMMSGLVALQLTHE